MFPSDSLVHPHTGGSQNQLETGLEGRIPVP